MMKKISLFIWLSFMLSLILGPSSGKDHFILGSAEGDGQLIYPGQIKEGPDGNIYVYDRSDAFIKVYSPEGKYLRRMGGQGQGPGEIQRADGANFGFTPAGKLCFTESFGGHRWITLMELSGELHKVLHPEINKVYGIGDSFALDDGGFLLEINYMFEPEMKEGYFLYRYPQVLVRMNSQGKIVSEIIKTNYFQTISGSSSGADQWLPFIPAFAWLSFKGDTVIFSDGLSRNLRVYDYEGKLTREIKTMLPDPEKVTGKDLDEWRRLRKEAVRDASWWNRFGKVVEKYRESVYDKKPVLSGISSTPNGNVLISGPSREGEKTKYWLVDEKGDTLVELDLSAGMLRISKDFIFFSTIDEEANLQVHALERAETESKDLLRVKDAESIK